MNGLCGPRSGTCQAQHTIGAHGWNRITRSGYCCGRYQPQCQTEAPRTAAKLHRARRYGVATMKEAWLVQQSRSISAYVMHGHLDQGVLDYENFFEWVAETPSPATQVSVSRDLDIAIERATRNPPFFDLRFVSGNPREVPLFYNETTGHTERAAVREGVWLAEPTRVTVMPIRRLMFIEGRKKGVGATSLERYFETLARLNDYTARLKFDLAPLPSPSFEEELNQLVRIREAALEVSRPNTDWDDANDVLSELADESHGHAAQVVVTAARGDSLSRTAGIVGLIRKHIRRGLTNVRNARVFGRREGEKKETLVSIQKHQLRRTAVIETSAPEAEQDAVVFREAHALAEIAESAAPVLDTQANGLDTHHGDL
jgi:hypothetical protein